MCGRAATASSSPTGISRSRPEFLRATLSHLRAQGIDVIAMDEVHRRLVERNFSRRFACFTLDDGYRDNRDFALPVLREFDAPFTVYVTSDFAEGTGRLWWIALEAVIARRRVGRSRDRRRDHPLRYRNSGRETIAFDRLHDWLRGLPGEHDLAREIGALCARYGVDEAAICRDLCMSWDELKPFADDPLIAIGAHSITHCNLARQTEATARREMTASRERIEAAMQRPVRPSRLSLWRQGRGRRPRIRAGAGGRIQHRGDDAAGHDLSREREPSDGAAAGFAQRQLSGCADSAGADLRRRHRDVERFSPHRRGVRHRCCEIVMPGLARAATTFGN